MSIENRKIVLNIIASGIFATTLVLIPANFALMPVACIMLMAVVSIFIARSGVNRVRLQKDVCRTLDSEGYDWKMCEGDLYISKGDICFQTVMWDMGVNKSNKRTYFIYRYSGEKLGEIDKNGLLHLVSITNYENPHVTMVLESQECLYCRFETCVCSSKDFMQEFKVAYNKIGEAVCFFWENFNSAKNHFPNYHDSSIIGFVKSTKSERIASL